MRPQGPVTSGHASRRTQDVGEKIWGQRRCGRGTGTSLTSLYDDLRLASPSQKVTKELKAKREARSLMIHDRDWIRDSRFTIRAHSRLVRALRGCTSFLCRHQTVNGTESRTTNMASYEIQS